jgi:DNA-3-methyladenine glycosylase
MRERRWGMRATAGRDRDLTNGPGKLCAALGIDGRLSGLSLQRPPVVIRRGIDIPDADVGVSPRIGITRAAEAMHRYFVRRNEFVSKAGSGPRSRKGSSQRSAVSNSVTNSKGQ